MTLTRRVVNGAKLREIRQDKGPRQGLPDFARACGIHLTTLSRIETGSRQPSHDALCRIVEALESLGYLPAGTALDTISTRVPHERPLRKAA
jgi:transcriptional regulator with XRE-family HTH domain